MVDFETYKFVILVFGIISIGFLVDVASNLFSDEISNEVEQKRIVPSRLVPYTVLVLFALLASCVVTAIEKWVNPEHRPVPEPTPPRGIKKLNDSIASIWVLHAPEGPPSMDIIFFHGLIDHDDVENAFWKTWLVKDDKKLIWPKEWLSENEFFPDARMLSISCPRVDDLYVVTENLVEDFIGEGIGQKCPVFFVGHSLGGIAINQLLLSAVLYSNQFGHNHAQRDKVNLFLENVLGVLYYSTPHLSSSIGSSTYSMNLLANRNPDAFISLHADTARVNDRFKRERSTSRSSLNHVLMFAMADGLTTKYPGGDGFVVDDRSTIAFSKVNSGEHVHVHEQADHFTVSRAKDRDDVVIRHLRDLILKSLDSFRVPYTRRSPVRAPPSREAGDNHQNDSSIAGVTDKSVDIEMTESRVLS